MNLNDIKNKSMTKEKNRKDKADIFTYYVFRPLSNILAVPFIKVGMSATLITKISVVFDFIAFLLIVFGNEKKIYICGMLCLLIWNILDHIDGTVARYTNTCSKIGELWDAVGGYFATFVLFNSLGIIAYKGFNMINISFIQDYMYLILGNLSAFFLLFPRLVMHKKENLDKISEVKGISDKENFNIIKLIVRNLISINGIGFIIALISIFLNISNLCIVCYFFVNMVIFLGTSKKLLF